MNLAGQVRRGKKDNRGAAAVEFALVLPLLMLLVLGGLDWGYYFYVAQVVTNAAREGSRAGTLELDDVDAVNSATSTANGYLSGAGLDTGLATVNAQINLTAGGGDEVQVDVTYPAGSLTGFTEIVVPALAQSSAVMRRL